MVNEINKEVELAKGTKLRITVDRMSQTVQHLLEEDLLDTKTALSKFIKDDEFLKEIHEATRDNVKTIVYDVVRRELAKIVLEEMA